MNLWEKLIDPIAKVINKTMDKIAGDKMSQAEREEFKLLAKDMLAKELQAEENNFRNFVLDYEGRALDMPRFIQILRGSVRPVLTYSLFLLWGWGYYHIFTQIIAAEKESVMRDMMGMLFKLNIISLTFWYGEKFVIRSGLFKMMGSKKDKKEE